MTSKKGFIFVETIVVMVVVMLSLTLLLGTFVILTSISKSRKYYDRVNDIYLLDNFIHYTELTTPLKDVNVASGAVQLTSDNCSSNFGMPGDCDEIMDLYNIKNIIILVDVNEVLSVPLATYSNSTIEYFKTLDKGSTIKYIIGVFERENEQYFASLKVG